MAQPLIPKLALAMSGAALVITLTAGSALAGENTGKGDATAVPEHANSICAFSG